MIRVEEFTYIFKYNHVMRFVEPTIYNVDFGTDEKYLQCMLTWGDAVRIPGFVDHLAWYMEKLEPTQHIVWFSSEDENSSLYKGNKPFNIMWVGVCQDGSLLLSLRGQQSTKIERKWTNKLTKHFGRKVTLVWEEDE